MVPIVKHLDPRPAPGIETRVESVARDLEDEHPALIIPDELRLLAPDRLPPGPALHLDDLANVSYLAPDVDKSFLQERARLRADHLDTVVTCLAPPGTWETYYRRHLGLGAPTWLHAEPCDGPEAVAGAARDDRTVRRELIRAVRRGELRFVHPHMGTPAVWQLADLLQRSARRPLQVIAPPPGLTRLVNDKLTFADIVTRLLGPGFTPTTQQASNFAHVSQLVQALVPDVQTIVLKLPDSMAAGGTMIIEADALRGRSLTDLREELRARFDGLTWDGASPLLVGSWETDVLSSPSAQLWIPPPADGPPIVEGIFEQRLHGDRAEFVGSHGADLPPDVLTMIGEPVLSLALLLQRLGYVGRCSLDMLLVGPTLDAAALEFIECNGRWGGTSLPMTLMNRLFGDWATRPYVTTTIAQRGLDRVSLGELLETFAPLLYDARTGDGRVLFHGGARLRNAAALNIITLGATVADAIWIEQTEVRPQLRALARSAAQRV
jgi:hypothetical protein